MIFRCEDCGEEFAAPVTRIGYEWLGEFRHSYRMATCPACGSEAFHETEEPTDE